MKTRITELLNSNHPSLPKGGMAWVAGGGG